jgi:hypothetical protein
MPTGAETIAAERKSLMRVMDTQRRPDSGQ